MVPGSKLASGLKLQIFPPWFDIFLKIAGAAAGLGGLHFLVVLYLGFNPLSTDFGYMPEQPVPYSHKLHAGELGIDCRYCHNTVEESAHASIPPTSTCMNCHENIRTASPLLEPIRDAYETGDPVPWVRIHDLADFAYFNHSAHVRRGIGCVSCHGRVDRMEVVYQAETLSMAWCLDCHRNPEQHLRPKDQITNMAWDPERDAGKTQAELGAELRKLYDINPSTDCSTCHR